MVQSYIMYIGGGLIQCHQTTNYLLKLGSSFCQRSHSTFIINGGIAQIVHSGCCDILVWKLNLLGLIQIVNKDE